MWLNEKVKNRKCTVKIISKVEVRLTLQGWCGFPNKLKQGLVGIVTKLWATYF